MQEIRYIVYKAKSRLVRRRRFCGLVAGILPHVNTFVLPFKLSCFGALLSSFANHNQEVLCKHKGHALSLVAKLLLFVVKEMAKIYVKQL